eukprot:3206734-Amphidinium_carterae.1
MLTLRKFSTWMPLVSAGFADCFFRAFAGSTHSSVTARHLLPLRLSVAGALVHAHTSPQAEAAAMSMIAQCHSANDGNHDECSLRLSLCTLPV